MTAPGQHASPGRDQTTAIRAVAESPLSMWIAFILVHLVLGLLCIYTPSQPLGDVTGVYRFWADMAIRGDSRVGIDSAWVYPILALVPMLAAAAFGTEHYAATWLTIVLLLDAIAFGFLTDWGRSRARMSTGWWWILFLLLLGPIAVARLDSITVAIALTGLLLIAQRPRIAAAILVVATWIKVWPAALLAAAVILLPSRWRIMAAAVTVSAVILLAALTLGSGTNVFSFVTQQTGRSIQVEAPIATIWLWMAAAGVPDVSVYFDRDIITYQVAGRGVDIAAAVMTPILAAVVIAIAVLGVRASRAGADPARLLPPLALAFVAALIAFNKVGSPQFIGWLAVPIVLGLLARIAGSDVSFRFPAVVGLAIAGLTQIVYPYLYDFVILLNPAMLAVLTLRNLLEFALVGWAVLVLARVRGRGIRIGGAGRTPPGSRLRSPFSVTRL